MIATAAIAVGAAAAQAEIVTPQVVTPQVVTPRVVTPAPQAGAEPAPLVAAIDPTPPTRSPYGGDWGTPLAPSGDPSPSDDGSPQQAPAPDSDAYRQAKEDVERVTALIKSISIAVLYGGNPPGPDQTPSTPSQGSEPTPTTDSSGNGSDSGVSGGGGLRDEDDPGLEQD